MSAATMPITTDNQVSSHVPPCRADGCCIDDKAGRTWHAALACSVFSNQKKSDIPKSVAKGGKISWLISPTVDYLDLWPVLLSACTSLSLSLSLTAIPIHTRCIICCTLAVRSAYHVFYRLLTMLLAAGGRRRVRQ